MPDDNCKSLAEDLEGNLWIVAGDRLLRERGGKFKMFTKMDGLTQDKDVGSFMRIIGGMSGSGAALV